MHLQTNYQHLVDGKFITTVNYGVICAPPRRVQMDTYLGSVMERESLG
jgi:hypothetical protein